jgi:hypothetical protein
VKQARLKARRFKVMLHQPGNIGVVFKNKYGLAQLVSPRPAVDCTVWDEGPQETNTRVIQSGKQIANV